MTQPNKIHARAWGNPTLMSALVVLCQAGSSGALAHEIRASNWPGGTQVRTLVAELRALGVQIHASRDPHQPKLWRYRLGQPKAPTNKAKKTF